MTVKMWYAVVQESFELNGEPVPVSKSATFVFDGVGNLTGRYPRVNKVALHRVELSARSMPKMNAKYQEWKQSELVQGLLATQNEYLKVYIDGGFIE